MNQSRSYTRGIATGFVGAMVLTLGAIMVLLGAGIFTLKGCWERDRNAYYQTTGQFQSPDGKHVALCYTRWIGPNEEFSTDFIDICASNSSRDPSLSFRESGYEFYIESHHDANFKWIDGSHASISYRSTDTEVHSFQKPFNDDKTVTLNYQIIAK